MPTSRTRRTTGDSLGSSRAQSRLPIPARSLALLNDVAEADRYLHLHRRAILKWHEGFEIISVRAYRAGYIVETRRLDRLDERAYIAAVDVDHPSPTRTRVRAIGTTLMAFLHSTSTGAETTMHRYFYTTYPEHGVLGPASPLEAQR